MFTLLYLALLTVSVVPLTRTALRGLRLKDEFDEAECRVYMRQLRVSATQTAVLLCAIVALIGAINISADAYWFQELGQSDRFWRVLTYECGIFAVSLVVVGLFLGANLGQLVVRRYALIPVRIPFLAGFALALLWAYSFTGYWSDIFLFLGSAPTGTLDPVYGLDTSFYLNVLPLFQSVAQELSWLTVVMIVFWLVIGFMINPKHGRPGDTLKHLRGEYGFRYASERAGFPLTTEGVQDYFCAVQEVWRGWVRQGCGLIGLLFLSNAADRFLGRYGLVVDGHSSVVSGAAYIDVYWWSTIYSLIGVAWLLAALAFLGVAFIPRLHAWFLARQSRWLMPGVAFVALFVGAPTLALLYENVFVVPNQVTLEEPFIVHTIAGTREAFNLSGPRVEEHEFPVSAQPLTAADLAANIATLRDARIWDWRVLNPQIHQTQGLRQYYTFHDIDIDRYKVDGELRQVMITARELSVDRLLPQAQVWVNTQLKYTHGFGVVSVPSNETVNGNNPRFWAGNIPVTALPALSVTHPEIYYGELTNEHVYVHGTEREFDFPQGDSNVESVYGGRGGIQLSDFWRKLVYAWKFDGITLFTSNYLTDESRILWRRNILERVKALAPFLTFDDDPYVVAGGDRYLWIIDAYTSSDTYPYSEAYRGSVAAFKDKNYVRNSVKVVVDAYDGSVAFYVMDPHDPLINAYRAQLPGLFKGVEEMPPLVRSHIRYPAALFTTQAEMYGTFHMTNPMVFYNREDRWQVPRELFRSEEIEMSPYYVTAQLPGASRPEFMLMLPLSVAGKNQMSGWMAGLCDGDNYGKLIVYKLPKGVFVDGPAQVESRISSTDRMSQDLTLWDQHGSTVIRGNLLVLPLKDDKLVVIEPIYVEASQTKIPQLTRVVFGQLLPGDQQIVWAPQLEQAEQLFVGAAPQSVASRPGDADETGTIAQVRAVFGRLLADFRAGEFAKAGQALQELKGVLGQ